MVSSVKRERERAVLSRTYRLQQPGRLEEVRVERPFREGEVVVEPFLASICQADLRYFSGRRRKEALAKKLPMALIHEGIGRVVQSGGSRLRPGDRVVIVPNLPGCGREDCPACSRGIGTNYCLHSRFLGSGTDGIAQSRIVLPVECAIPSENRIPDEILVLAELCSVSYHAIRRVDRLQEERRVVVFGDGPVGYLTAAMLHHIFGMGPERLWVFGAVPERLEQFTFARRILVGECDFRPLPKAGVAFECTGGHFSREAINQAIEVLNPGGVLVLMGVSEEPVPVNTRDVLEKGITLIGSSRSSARDYPPVLKAMEDPACQRTLSRLLPDQRTPVHSVADLTAALDRASRHKAWKKTLLEFHW
ncbi:MAG: alcohol dehydrogenase catalytic domain-containing protein [Planifilum sp.]|jgi:ribitol-5-phosphate 2-dehydrogenase